MFVAGGTQGEDARGPRWLTSTSSQAAQRPSEPLRIWNRRPSDPITISTVEQDFIVMFYLQCWLGLTASGSSQKPESVTSTTQKFTISWKTSELKRCQTYPRVLRGVVDVHHLGGCLPKFCFVLICCKHPETHSIIQCVLPNKSNHTIQSYNPIISNL